MLSTQDKIEIKSELKAARRIALSELEMKLSRNLYLHDFLRHNGRLKKSKEVVDSAGDRIRRSLEDIFTRLLAGGQPLADFEPELRQLLQAVRKEKNIMRLSQKVSSFPGKQGKNAAPDEIGDFPVSIDKGLFGKFAQLDNEDLEKEYQLLRSRVHGYEGRGGEEDVRAMLALEYVKAKRDGRRDKQKFQAGSEQKNFPVIDEAAKTLNLKINTGKKGDNRETADGAKQEHAQEDAKEFLYHRFLAQGQKVPRWEFDKVFPAFLPWFKLFDIKSEGAISRAEKNRLHFFFRHLDAPEKALAAYEAVRGSGIDVRKAFEYFFQIESFAGEREPIEGLIGFFEASSREDYARALSKILGCPIEAADVKILDRHLIAFDNIIPERRFVVENDQGELRFALASGRRLKRSLFLPAKKRWPLNKENLAKVFGQKETRVLYAKNPGQKPSRLVRRAKEKKELVVDLRRLAGAMP